MREGGASKLLAFDFASADLENLTGRTFPIAEMPTRTVGSLLRDLHGFDHAAAREMIDRIIAIPPEKIERIVSNVPNEWYSETQKGKLIDGWSNGAVGDRLADLHRGLSDGSLL